MSASASPRLTCVYLHELPLQVARRGSPHLPALATSDRPGESGQILHLDDEARRRGARLGMRVAVARGICPDLTIIHVDQTARDLALEELSALLERFTPRVEASDGDPGAFWLDPTGMSRLFGAPDAWAAAIRRALVDASWRASIVVGFRRFHSHAIARGRRDLLVLRDLADEDEHAAATDLAALNLPKARLDELDVLEVRRLGDLLRLPAAGLRRRFGPEIADLHARAAGLDWAPLRPRSRRAPLTTTISVDPPDDDRDRLLFAIKAALDPLIARLEAADTAARAIDVTLHLDHSDPVAARIEPAAPTRDRLVLLDLIRLRLAAVALQAPVTDVDLQIDEICPEVQQVDLLTKRSRRDPAAADAAIARLRAAYGDAAVTRAALRSAHLPEASFTWEPIQRAPTANAPPRPLAANLSDDAPPLCRRLFARPRPLQSAPSPADPPPLCDLDGLARGPILRLDGPYRVSGGWWVRQVERDYYYADTAGGELLWIFYDRPRARWFLHGIVD
jgi:protein ImuB